MDDSTHLHHFEDMEDEDKPYDMEEPNFFGLSIAYDPYMREVVKADVVTTCGGDGGRMWWFGDVSWVSSLFAPLQTRST